MSNKPANKFIVLMYHRIAATAIDPWGLSVSPKNFDQQLKALSDKFLVISVTAALQQLKNGHIEQDAICITFDDGYADNFINAKPLLEKYNCPATFFLTTGKINKQQSFWWDELCQLILSEPELPEHLSVKIGEDIFKHQLLEPKLSPLQMTLHKKWKYHEPPVTDRCALYLTLWKKMVPLRDYEIRSTLSELRKWLPNPSNTEQAGIPMSDVQLHELSELKQFSIGLHTDTHADLSTLTRDEQFSEIDQSNKILQTNSIFVPMFSYPYGKYNILSQEILKQLSIQAAFTTVQEPVFVNSDLLQLGRFQIFDWNGRLFENYIDEWMSK